MTEALLNFIHNNSIKGFLSDQEGLALYQRVLQVCHLGPCLEIGSYCGKSTVFIGKACQQRNGLLVAIDHHRGSEEHQPGQEYHDIELLDYKRNGIDTFSYFRQTLELAELESTVIPIVASSHQAARFWSTPLSFVFVDGGHSPTAAMFDCQQWSQHILAGGILAIHDIFPDPAQGGQGPYQALQHIYESGSWKLCEQVGSLGILERKQ